MSTPTPPGYGAPGAPQMPSGMSPMNPYAAQAAKPGIVPLRPLKLGDNFEGAFAAIRHNPKVMLGVSALIIVIAAVIGMAISAAFIPLVGNAWDSITSDPTFNDLPGLSDAISPAWTTLAMGSGLALPIAMPIIQGLLTVSVSRSVIGERATPAQVWAKLKPRIWPLIAWMLLQIVIAVVASLLFAGVVYLIARFIGGGVAVALIVLLSIAFLLLAIWVSVKILLVPPALALEGLGVWATVSRVWELSKGSWWRMFGIYFLASLIIGVITSIVAMPISMIFAFMGNAGFGIGSILTSLLTTLITTVFVGAIVALLYIDLRMRKENLAPALEAAAAGVARSAGAAPAAPAPGAPADPNQFPGL